MVISAFFYRITIVRKYRKVDIAYKSRTCMFFANEIFLFLNNEVTSAMAKINRNKAAGSDIIVTDRLKQFQD